MTLSKLNELIVKHNKYIIPHLRRSWRTFAKKPMRSSYFSEFGKQKKCLTGTYRCVQECCIYRTFFNKKEQKIWLNGPRKTRSGCIIYDTCQKKMLMVQTMGQYWGFPKGMIEDNEDSKTCAIRETKEETGYELTHNDLLRMIKIDSNIFYFVKGKVNNNIKPLTFDNNDATGIAWISPDCIYSLERQGRLTKHAIQCLSACRDIRLIPK
jgi:ADP-ribose pyrophosphatase YjhB (NUDIX family)